MQKVHENFWMTCILFLVTGLVSRVGALDSPVVDLSKGDQAMVETGALLLDNAILRIWSNESTPDDNRALLNRSKILFESISDEAVRAYFLAQVELNHGRLDLYGGAKEKSRAYFEKAIELAQQSVDLRESSDGYRVLAAAGGSWMSTKGLGGIISMAPKVQEWSDRSLEINPQNVFATIISALGQINAPRAFGGNPQEAARRLEAQIRRNDLNDIERCWTLVTLAQARVKLKEKDEAIRLCEQAKAIFPNNIMIKGCP